MRHAKAFCTDATDLPHYRYRALRSKAQHKLGNDVWRSMYYREDWGQPWQQIARTVPRLRRWALHKYNSPPAMYRRLKSIDQAAPDPHQTRAAAA